MLLRRLGIALVGIALVATACGAPAGTSAPSPAASASAGASGGASANAPCQPNTANPTPISFQLNFTAGGYNSGFALALQEGYYKDVGLNVTIVKGQGSGTTAKLVASGQAALAYADSVAVMQLIAKGAKMKILSTMYQSVPNAVTSLASSGITKFSDLRGKKIASPIGETPTAVFPILLQANGMTEKDVQVVPMPGTAMVAALMQHQVDAILGSTDGYDLILQQNGSGPLTDFVFADYGVKTVSTSIFASESFLASNGNDVKCFIQASLKGWDEAIKNPQKAIDDLVKTFPYDTKADLNLGQLKAAIDLFCKSGAKFVGKAEPEAWASTAEVAQNVLSLPKDTPATAYYTYDYLPGTLPTACPIKK